MDINQAWSNATAKESARIAKQWAPRRVWPLYGLRYRILMRTMHWLGYCYMKPLLGLRDDDRSIPPRIHHRCDWCGMNGTK